MPGVVPTTLLATCSDCLDSYLGSVTPKIYVVCWQGEAEDGDMADAVDHMLTTLRNTGLQAVQDEKVVEHAVFTQLMQLLKVHAPVNQPQSLPCTRVSNVMAHTHFHGAEDPCQ